MKPISTLRNIYNDYPRQYWLMITGVVLSTAGGSMIWPFLIIYASGKLHLPLSTVAALISINAGTGLIASLVAGTLADKVGRKGVMNFSLTVNGIAYFLLMRAETYPHFVILMMLVGLSNPLYQVGADAMLADICRTYQAGAGVYCRARRPDPVYPSERGQQVAELLVIIAQVESDEVGAAEDGAQCHGGVMARELLSG